MQIQGEVTTVEYVTQDGSEFSEGKKVNVLIDHWDTLVGLVPGIRNAVLKLLHELNGSKVKECNGGEKCSNGFREGTRFLHLYGVSSKVPLEIFKLIENMGRPFLDKIEQAIEDLVRSD